MGFSGQNPHFSKPYSSKRQAATSFQVYTGYLELESLYFYVFTFLNYGIRVELPPPDVNAA
jgi:hypothetical protein